MNKELILTSSRDSQLFSACIWDPSTGNALHQYKNGGVIAPSCLAITRQNYLISIDATAPLTHFWPLNSQEPDKKLTTVLPQAPKALALCPHSLYLAAGIGTGLYIWQLNSGKLLSIQRRHFQAITRVRFSQDGALVLAAGEDGMLVVYKVVTVLEDQGEPLYVKNDHVLPITDLYCSGGKRGKVVTSSLDNTWKVYTLGTGRLVKSAVTESGVTSVVSDAPFWNVFSGQESGKIECYNLKNQEKRVFHGHTKKVTCLTLPSFNGMLFSGSEDHFVFIWDIETGQVLKKIEHKAEITNVRCVIMQEKEEKGCLKKLERELVESEDFEISVLTVEEPEDEEDAFTDLRKENASLRGINQALFQAALNISRKYNKMDK